MFDDAYRRANEALHPAPPLKQDTIAAMEGRKRPVRRRQPLYIAATAAALALVLLLTGLPGLDGGSDGAVMSLSAYAISEPAYPAFPQRINAAHQAREDYYGEYRTYREELGLIEEFDADFATKVGDFSAETSRLLLSGANENRLYSPASFWIALGMLSETTGGESRQQILEALGVEDREALRAGTQALWRRLYRDDGVAATRLANSLWLNERFTYLEEPLHTLSDCYYAASYAVDMGAKEADQAIAAWLDEQTENLLQESTSGIKTDPLTALRLYSTIYYYGGWSSEFHPSDNTEGTFTRADGTEVTATFMHKTQDASALIGDTYTESY